MPDGRSSDAATDKATIILVHGAWVTARSWAPFKAALEDAGHAVITPTWPGLDGLEAWQLNETPPDRFGALTIGRIVNHYAAVVSAQAEPPILVGHSVGGLLVQKLLDLGLGRAGVAINPAPIGGVVPGKTTLSAIHPALLRWNGWNRPYAHSRESFGRLYANTAPEGLVDDFYATAVIPAPGRIFFQAATWLGTKVDANRRRQPLLITGSEQDRLVSPYLSQAAFRIQRRSDARTDYRFYENLSHLLIAEPGYERVAADITAWIAALPAD